MRKIHYILIRGLGGIWVTTNVICLFSYVTHISYNVQPTRDGVYKALESMPIGKCLK